MPAFKTIPRHARSFAETVGSRLSKPFGVLTTLAVFVLLLVIGSIISIQYLQAEQAWVREEAKLGRNARQAIADVNTVILGALSQPGYKFDQVGYWRATEVLAKFPASTFPAVTERMGVSVPTQTILAEIKSSWADTVAQINDLPTAQAIYYGRETPLLITDTTAALTKAIDRFDDDYVHYAHTTWLLIGAVLLLQAVAGVICLMIFRRGARRSGQEAIARMRAVTEAETSREQVTRLFQMADMLQSAGDYADANEVLRASAAELIFGFSGALYVFNNSRDRLVLSTSWEREGYDALPESLGMDQCWALKRGKPHINRPHSRKLCCSHHTSGDYALEIPMLARGETLGLLQIYAEGDDAELRLEKVHGLGTALADAMSLALSNIALREKLRGQALRDPLTGLYNRRYMEDALERFVRLAERENRDLSVIMIDLDHFKRLNDQYGHAKGDSTLRDAASVISHMLRESDVACRYGGEELIVLLPDCGIEMAANKAEQIRIGIESLSQPNGAQVSASFGVSATPAASSKDLVAQADAALYRAKQGGRNRVVRSAQRPQVSASAVSKKPAKKPDTVVPIADAAE
jgi:diguanylate cyclase (GGDEF)-like protein